MQVSVSGRLLSRMPFGSVHGELLYLAKGSSIALARGNGETTIHLDNTSLGLLAV